MVEVLLRYSFQVLGTSINIKSFDICPIHIHYTQSVPVHTSFKKPTQTGSDIIWHVLYMITP